ncbi:MAG: hypothetical protein H6679_01950 [Epsilonproteobacteria bacterium]|nr:hypothetical protein [Campylobacterota bacterium]
MKKFLLSLALIFSVGSIFPAESTHKQNDQTVTQDDQQGQVSLLENSELLNEQDLLAQETESDTTCTVITDQDFNNLSMLTRKLAQTIKASGKTKECLYLLKYREFFLEMLIIELIAMLGNDDFYEYDLVLRDLLEKQEYYFSRLPQNVRSLFTQIDERIAGLGHLGFHDILQFINQRELLATLYKKFDDEMRGLCDYLSEKKHLLDGENADCWKAFVSLKDHDADLLLNQNLKKSLGYYHWFSNGVCEKFSREEKMLRSILAHCQKKVGKDKELRRQVTLASNKFNRYCRSFNCFREELKKQQYMWQKLDIQYFRNEQFAATKLLKSVYLLSYNELWDQSYAGDILSPIIFPNLWHFPEIVGSDFAAKSFCELTQELDSVFFKAYDAEQGRIKIRVNEARAILKGVACLHPNAEEVEKNLLNYSLHELIEKIRVVLDGLKQKADKSVEACKKGLIGSGAAFAGLLKSYSLLNQQFITKVEQGSQQALSDFSDYVEKLVMCAQNGELPPQTKVFFVGLTWFAQELEKSDSSCGHTCAQSRLRSLMFYAKFYQQCLNVALQDYVPPSVSQNSQVQQQEKQDVVKREKTGKKAEEEKQSTVCKEVEQSLLREIFNNIGQSHILDGHNDPCYKLIRQSWAGCGNQGMLVALYTNEKENGFNELGNAKKMIISAGDLERTSRVKGDGAIDRFHRFSPLVDNYLEYGLLVRHGQQTDHAIAKSLTLKAGQCAVIIDGKLVLNKYAYHGQAITPNSNVGIKGAFVYIFDENKQTCVHRFFHKA